MKLRGIIILLSVIFLASCSEDLLDVKFDADYKTDLEVKTDNEKAGKGTFSVLDTIDPSSDEEVKKYYEEIKDWNIKSLKGTFKNVSEDFVLTEGVLKIKAKDFEAKWTLENVTGKNAEKVVLENLNGQFEQINKILKDKIPFVIDFSGTTNKDNIEYELEMLMKTEVTANPL